MFHLGKSVLAVAAIIVMAGLPPSAAMAKMAAVRHLSTESFSADAGLVHKTGMRPISGAYRASRPAGPGAIAGTNPHAGVTLPEKSYRALIRATYPVALPHKPRIRHVQRQHKATPRLKSAGYSPVRWSSSSGRRNTAMAPYIRRY